MKPTLFLDRADDWAKRHNDALKYVTLDPPHSFEGSIATICVELKAYADAHRARFETPIGKDYVLGPAWLDMLKGVRTLLNGEVGRLDCGTVDGYLVDLALSNGFEEEDL